MKKNLNKDLKKEEKKELKSVVFFLSSMFFSLSLGSKVWADANLIKADGSSTVFPVTEAVAEEFQTSQKGKIRVTVGKSGTGGGFKKFCRGEIDVQNASRPIQLPEMETCKKAGVKYFEIPIAYDAIVVVVHPQNNWTTEISVADLKKIWHSESQGKQTLWSDINASWPRERIRLFGAGSDSGTFDYFTEAVNGKAKLSRGDYTASEDDNILVKGVSSDKYALGYIPYSYFSENQRKLKALAILSEKSKAAVLPGQASIEKGSYFPLSRPVFIYVSEKSYQRPEVRGFVEFYLNEGPGLIREVKYVPLPAQAYSIAKDHLKKNKLGTVFGGHAEIGLKIEDLMKRELAL